MCDRFRFELLGVSFSFVSWIVTRLGSSVVSPLKSKRILILTPNINPPIREHLGEANPSDKIENTPRIWFRTSRQPLF